jgi:hypothetical protein
MVKYVAPTGLRIDVGVGTTGGAVADLLQTKPTRFSRLRRAPVRHLLLRRPRLRRVPRCAVQLVQV